MQLLVNILRHVAIAAFVLWLHPAVAETAAALDVRIGRQGEATRVVVDLSGSASARLFVLPEPTRVVVDLPGVTWRAPQSGPGLDHVLRFRFGQFDPQTARLVLDTAGPLSIADAYIIPAADGRPFRLVVDLAPIDAAGFAAQINRIRTVGSGLAAAEAPVPPAPAPAPRAPRIVAVDAGHGGNDPGASGLHGVYEKQITLAVARLVRDALEATGRYKVVMTRDRDVFMPLRDRIQVARDANAELFVSLHADSLANRDVRGASVYTLSDTASDKEAEALAAKENRADIIAGVELSDDPDVASILIDLAQRDTMNQSRRFAGDLVAAMEGKVRLLPKAQRYAGFAVLKAPDVPSVLVEMGYLSNAKDATLLLDEDHQRKFAELLRDAIDAYFARAGGGGRT